jgi:hypothetical protein
MSYSIGRHAHILGVKSTGWVVVAVRVHAIAYREIRDISSNGSNRSAAVGTENGSRLYRSPGARSLGCVPTSKPRVFNRDEYVTARKPWYRDSFEVDRFGRSSGLYHCGLHGFREC